MYQSLLNKEKTIAVVGLGYVGLPLALEFARHFRVIGFDINKQRVALMQQGIDPSKEVGAESFVGRDITFSTDKNLLRQANFFIVAVPTDIDEHKVPNLRPIKSASKSVGEALKKGDYVVYESTVYPGCTEEDCLPILEAASGLQLGVDFKLGYSPERINPGDKIRTLTTILKIVSGSDAEALDTVAKIYERIITAGVYRAASIKVAEAAKVIENTQRDLNISLMNELSIIFDLMKIDTAQVLEAAGTKWNFLKFFPGLVGGHCIAVDPYYLLHKSRELGYDPQVIASGRRINDYMPAFVAKRLVQMLIEKGKNPGQSKVLVMGITFKENVADIRNSKVVDLIRELNDFSVNVSVTDPYAAANEVMHEYGIELAKEIKPPYDAIILAVAHDEYKRLDASFLHESMPDKPILVDLKGIFGKARHEMTYWKL